MSDYKLFYMTCKNKVEANKIAYDLVKNLNGIRKKLILQKRIFLLGKQ